MHVGILGLVLVAIECLLTTVLTVALMCDNGTEQEIRFGVICGGFLIVIFIAVIFPYVDI